MKSIVHKLVVTDCSTASNCSTNQEERQKVFEDLQVNTLYLKPMIDFSKYDEWPVSFNSKMMPSARLRINDSLRSKIDVRVNTIETADDPFQLFGSKTWTQFLEFDEKAFMTLNK